MIMNKSATNYGLDYGDYVRMLIFENEEKETLKQSKILEEERAQFAGKKSRRERRIAKDKRLKEKGDHSPLSYIVVEKTKRKSDDEESEKSARSSCSFSSSSSPPPPPLSYRRSRQSRSKSRSPPSRRKSSPASQVFLICESVRLRS